MAQKQLITQHDLLTLANQRLAEHEDYIAGAQALSVEQKNGVLIFKGDYFFDEQGLPTSKSMAIFNLFKFLTQSLSGQYQLVD